MAIESEKIKKFVQKVCEKEGHKELTPLMFQILDYIRIHGNREPKAKSENVKEIIIRMED